MHHFTALKLLVKLQQVPDFSRSLSLSFLKKQGTDAMSCRCFIPCSRVVGRARAAFGSSRVSPRAAVGFLGAWTDAFYPGSSLSPASRPSHSQGRNCILNPGAAPMARLSVVASTARPAAPVHPSSQEQGWDQIQGPDPFAHLGHDLPAESWEKMPPKLESKPLARGCKTWQDLTQDDAGLLAPCSALLIQECISFAKASGETDRDLCTTWQLLGEGCKSFPLLPSV